MAATFSPSSQAEVRIHTELHARSRHLHEVVQEVFVSVLVARHLHLILGEHVVVHVVLLPLEPLSLFSQSGVFLLLFGAIVVSITLDIRRKTSTYLLLLRNALNLTYTRLTFLLSLKPT
jgi:hypothetical protein